MWNMGVRYCPALDLPRYALRMALLNVAGQPLYPYAPM